MAKENIHALSNEIDPSKVRQLQKRVNTNAQLIDTIVNKLVAQYCEQLDEYMNYVRAVVTDTDNPPTDKELDDFILNLPVLLYFTGEGQESLGVKEDVAKAIKSELYNDVFSVSEGTIADKTAQAELATQAEYITHIAYQRAYKKIKLRMEIANELLQSVKKVVSRRMSEYDISRVDPQRIGGR